MSASVEGCGQYPFCSAITLTIEVLKAAPDGQAARRQRLDDDRGARLYDARDVDPRQLTPIGVMLQSALVLAVPARRRSRPTREFAEARQSQGQGGQGIDYGTGGVGSLPHVTMELLRERLGSPR